MAHRFRILPLLVTAAVGGLLPVSPGVIAVEAAGVPIALVREGSDLPGGTAGDPVSSINNTAVNHVGGYAVNVNTTAGLSRIWGHAGGGPGTVLRTEGTYGSLVQTSFESFYGMGNAGELCYSASGNGGPVGAFDSVWLDDVPVTVEGNAAPGYPAMYWSFGSRPGVTGSGEPYWVGGLTNSAGGSTQIRGLWIGLGVGEILLGGKLYGGFPFPLGASNSPTFDYRLSAEATHHIAPVLLASGSTANDGAMLMDKAAIVLGGNIVREQTAVPASIGGRPGELWSNFDFCGVTETGEYFFSGDTQPATVDDEFIVKNGMIVYREGQIVDGETLSGAIEGAYMNESGDIAYIWDIQNNLLEALYVNDKLVLKEGDAVDFSGDGIVEPGSVLRDFTGISSLTVGERDVLGNVKVYFVADIDTLGTTTTTDDREAFFCIEVNVDVPIPVVLASFDLVAPADRPAVVLDWRTTSERDHAGFHVERSTAVEDLWTTRTDRLVTANDGRYAWTDDDVVGGTTYRYRLVAVARDGAREVLAPRNITTPAWTVRPRLEANAPNPFHATTRVAFVLPAPGPVRLRIFDAAGRLVRTLVDGDLPAGPHELVWDGRTASGAAPAGVYFYTLTAGGQDITRKMLRVLGG